MGMLVEGKWRPEAEEENHDTDSFNNVISPESKFQPEKGRYHLYISRACPWAHRTALVRRLRGLEDVISMDIVDPVRHDEGWEFASNKDGCTKDSINNSEYLREVYTAADSEFTGRVTVPVLWDKKKETIVNNESEEIARILNNSFEELGNEVELLPESLEESIDKTIKSVFDKVNLGVYKAGFAENQKNYDQAVKELFEKLEELEHRLDEDRFLFGDRVSLADLFLFATLFRFDAVYHTHFKCNIRKITEFENLWNYTRDLYQLKDISKTCRLDHVKDHYYRSHKEINPKGFVPVGPELDFVEDHGREKLSENQDEFFSRKVE